MAKEGLNLFADDGSTPTGPFSTPQEDPNRQSEPEDTPQMDLKTHGLKDAISGDIVKTLLIPEDAQMRLPNYVLDFRHAKTIRRHQIDTLATFLSDYGDTYIYICVPNGLDKIGMGESRILDNMLQSGISSVFGNSCTIYKNVQPGEPLVELKAFDPTTVRLEL